MPDKDIERAVYTVVRWGPDIEVGWRVCSVGVGTWLWMSFTVGFLLARRIKRYRESLFASKLINNLKREKLVLPISKFQWQRYPHDLKVYYYIMVLILQVDKNGSDYWQKVKYENSCPTHKNWFRKKING